MVRPSCPNALLHETRPNRHLRTETPQLTIAHRQVRLVELVGKESVTEGLVVRVRVENKVREVSVLDVALRDGTLSPLVPALGRELEDPTRPRDGDAVTGQFSDEWAHHFGLWSFAT